MAWFQKLCLGMLLCVAGVASAEEKTLHVCSEAGFLPFEMRKADGTWLGYEIELAQKFAENIKAKIDLIDMKFDGLIPALNISKTCDILVSAIGVDAQRKKQVLFSVPTYRSGYAAIVRKSDEKKFKFYQDLNQSTTKMAAESGTEAALYTQRVFAKTQILVFDNNSDPISALLTGKADAYIDDNVFLSVAVARFPGKLALLPFKILPHNSFGDIAFAFRKSDKALQQQFNAFFKAYSKSGELKKLQNNYFKEMRWLKDFPTESK